MNFYTSLIVYYEFVKYLCTLWNKKGFRVIIVTVVNSILRDQR